MLRLTMVLYSILGTTLAGIGVIVVLTMGRYDASAIIAGAALGALLALPAAWMVARQLNAR